MKYSTFKALSERFEAAKTAAEKRALRQERDYLYIATTGGKLSRAGEKRIKAAKKGIRLLKEINHYRDRILIIENDSDLYLERKLQFLEKLEDEALKKARAVLKALGVGVAYNTYAYLYDLKEGKGYQLGLNYIM